MKALSIHPQLTMSSREIAELVESRHDSVKRTIERLAEKCVIVQPPLVDEQFIDSKGRKRTEAAYRIGKRDSYVIVAQLSPEFTARLVDRWQELENKQAFALPDFTNPAEAARAWADERERADLAIKTKAEIGSRREATAMATASKAVRKLSALKREQDRKRIYCTIRRATVMYPGRQFNWRVLKSASMGMELPTIDVDDDLYGTVKAYHADVWLACYGLDVMNREEL